MQQVRISLDTTKLLGWRKDASSKVDTSKIGTVKAGMVKPT